MKYRCRACRSYDNLLLFRKLPSEKELLKPHLDKYFFCRLVNIIMRRLINDKKAGHSSARL